MIQLSERILVNKDWATVLFVLAIAIIALNKSIFSIRFNEFIKLGYSDKYNKVYKDTNNLLNWFTISMFIIQLISFSFFILLLLSFFNYTKTDNYITYIQIVTFLFVFVLSKFLIEKIIANAFNIEEVVEQFNLQKVIFRTYIGLFLLPINIILFYNDPVSKNFIAILICTVMTTCVFTYLVSIKNYQNIIFSKLFYFILYLCALEIGPYYFMYYWFTKGIA